MELFGMGFGELLLVLIVALIVWGPQKLPEIARQLGKWTSTLRKASTDLTTMVKREIEAEEKASRDEENSGITSSDNKAENDGAAGDEKQDKSDSAVSDKKQDENETGDEI